MTFKKLSNKRISIDIFTEENITSEYIAWLNDPIVVQYSNQRFLSHTRETCNNYFKSFKDTDNLFLSIQLNSNKLAIGTMTIYRDLHHQLADVGIMIGNKNYWGQGFGLEAWRLVTGYLATCSNIRKVTAGALDCNFGMIQLMINSGMKPDGIRVRHELMRGVERDIKYYAIYNENYIKN